MNILTIGGSGFLSGALVRESLAAKHRVWTITRGNKPALPGVNTITCDRADHAALIRAIAETHTTFDLLVDCIGYQPHEADQDIEIAREFAKHFVFISTDFVYDPAYRTVPQSLDNTHYETALPYGCNKRACEIRIQNVDLGDCRWTILRPCHIYGPNSLLGCLPQHSRDPQLITKLQNKEPITLVDGGSYLQQPIFAPDLAQTILSCANNSRAHRTIHHTAGPDVITSNDYYEIIAEVLNVPIEIKSMDAGQYLKAHPDHTPFICHRVYDLTTLQEAGLTVPATPIGHGLKLHTESLLNAPM